MTFLNPVTETADVNMTSKGQVLIPKAIRDRLGLIPGQRVRVGINDRGEAVIWPAEALTDAAREARSARARAAIDAIAGKYSTGQPTDEIMRELRGDRRP